MKYRLERWIVFHDALVGYIYDHPVHPPGTRVLTEKVRFVDSGNSEAECIDEAYKLGEPGTQFEHNQPLLGTK